jgi:hypothetical protein
MDAMDLAARLPRQTAAIAVDLAEPAPGVITFQLRPNPEAAARQARFWIAQAESLEQLAARQVIAGRLDMWGQPTPARPELAARNLREAARLRADAAALLPAE